MSAQAIPVGPIRVSPAWLELRERADGAARSRALAARLGDGPWVIHDLAAGTGSMGRWLAPLLAGPQQWVLHDRDADLLALAATHAPAGVGLETRLGDITRLRPEDLDGATLVTASALLDLLTEPELETVIALCLATACPVLLTLSVTGDVRLDPPDPLDARVAAAFDAHQRRSTARGRLLGPDAVDAAAERFRAAGATVLVAASPWRLGPAEAALAEEWLTGWADAACEHEPALAVEAALYRRRRVHEARAGRLVVTVGHADLLVLP
ncbi:MAG TPA: class I SAM-dependent methyltransferase [Gaiellaceae bacterium]|nr:class I SAM-dependent methyltransferase [Gaiellaceae bacterium]